MKKFSVILMALALVMGLSQCKKENTNANNDTPVLEGEEVQITLTLNSGSSNSKADVIPDDGQGIAPVRFKAKTETTPGDYIWVAYDGKNVGHLECTSLSTSTDQNGNQLGVFTGNITIAKVGDQPLYFYFLGNKQPTFVHDSDDHGIGYIVDLSDQSGELPVIAYAMSEQTYPSNDNKYTVKYNWLKNQCALVKFTMENIYGSGTAMSTANRNDQNANALYKTTKPITIYGMNNQVTIDLASPGASTADALWGSEGNWNHSIDASFSWDVKDESKGAITLYNPGESDEVRYAIVEPQNYSIVQGDLNVPFDASTDDYGFYGTYRLDGAIQNNAYYKDAKIDLVWHSGAFSVSATKQVVFSRGNLQYKHFGSSTLDGGTWRFAKHQYDWVGGLVTTSNTPQGNVVLNENDNNDETYAARSNNEHIGQNDYIGWIDLFGWGTGDNPTKHSTTNTDYSDWHEWGEHSIVNSGKPSNTVWWVTLKHNEWDYLITERTGHLSKLGGAQITTSDGTTVNGMIMLPDVWDGPSITPLTKPAAAYHGDCTDNKYDEAGWKNMEAHGAVFLPACGYRNGTDFDGGTQTSQNRGEYYSFTQSTTAASYSIEFEDYTSSDVFSLMSGEVMAPDNGHGVRLVHELNHGSKLGKIFGK